MKGDRSVPKEVLTACLSQLFPQERIIQGPKQIHNLFQTMNLLLKQESVEKVFISPEDRANIACLMSQFSPVQDKLRLVGTVQSTELSRQEELELKKVIVNEHVINTGDDSQPPDNNKEGVIEDLQMAREEIEAARADIRIVKSECRFDELKGTREGYTREEMDSAREDTANASVEMDNASEEMGTASEEMDSAREDISNDGGQYRVGCKVCGETINRERYHYGGKKQYNKKKFLAA